MKHLLLLAVFCRLLPAAWADHYDDEHRRGEPLVILYQHADFRGDSLVLYPGESIDNLSGRTFAGGNSLNDSISSIRVEGGAAVLVFENSRYRGEALRLTESVRDLSRRPLPGSPRGSWNDRISSLKVEGFHRRPGEREREIDPDVVIRRAYDDLLGREPDPRTLRDLRGRIIDQGWTELMVRDSIRRSEEFRREGPDLIIRRAYRDLLHREPDQDGLRNFRRMILEREWTEEQVRDAIRGSDEYRRMSGRH